MRESMELKKPGKKKKKPIGCSESTMKRLYREAVKKYRGEYCAECGTSNGVQIHHIVKCKDLLLRYDYKNGFPGCKEHHDWYETLEGRQFVNKSIGEDYEYLKSQERIGVRRFRTFHGLTPDDFLLFMKGILEKYIEGE